IGKDTHWALDDAGRDRVLAEHKKGNAVPQITRFKGLGETNPTVLKETTLDPAKRKVLRVAIADGDALATDKVISELLGKDSSARFRLITEGALEVSDIDV